MQIAIHLGFFNSLEKLSTSDRKRTMSFLVKIQEDPSSTGLRQHQVMNGFLSLSPTMGIRVIAQQIASKLILLYADHHDNAYKWAERHSLLADSSTDTYELITISSSSVEMVNEVPSSYGEEISRKLSANLFPEYIQNGFVACVSESDLLNRLTTMSPEWQETILHVITSDSENIEVPKISSSLVRVISKDESLSRALEFPIIQWRKFLHPKQQNVVSDIENPSICVVGGPGTGKSVVCAHRAVFLSQRLKSDEVVVVFPYSVNLVKIYGTCSLNCNLVRKTITVRYGL